MFWSEIEEYWEPLHKKVPHCQGCTTCGLSSFKFPQNFILKTRMMCFSRHLQQKCRNSMFMEQNNGFSLPATKMHGFHTENWGPRTEDWGVRIEKLRIENWWVRSEEWGFEDWGQPHTNWRHLDWPCGPHKFFWSSLTANQLITTCASLHTAASSHCQLFYSETGQYGRIVHLEEYRQPSPPVQDGLPILLPCASS